MKKRRVLIALAVVVVLGGLAWAFLPAGPDPQLAKVTELRDKLFSEDAQIPREDRRAAFREFRTEMEKLTPEAREKFIFDNPPPFMRRMQQNIVAFFDLPEDERTQALDKQIDEMERRRKEWEKRRGAAERRPGGGRGGFGRNLDPARRDQMRRRMLDHTTPQQRAMFSEYFRQLQTRRNQRGLPTVRGPRF